MEFAGIQCQIHFGDYQEDKHKPGLLENLKEYLPEQYSGSWGAEKKILKLFSKHQGLSSLDAKHLYNKTARELPTYGVTFFIVKEKQKGKKKMVPRLLGINSESILRLDEVTKEILQAWPLTHVRTYHAGKNTFTLNFGDYSDKEYSVKTNDALRIRDILEGYIDLIKKRMCGPSTVHLQESGAIGQEAVYSGRGNTMTHVVHHANKVVEHNFVGPTKLLPFEQGSQATTGTQVMTVQQVIVTNMGSTKQQVVTGEVPLRSDMSQDLVKKLNRMNSNAVKIVTLLTEPTKSTIQETRSIIAKMEEDMPIIQNGVKEAAEKQSSDEAKKKLLTELSELNALIASLSQKNNNDNLDAEQTQDEARQVADLTTQMYFSLDRRMSARSKLVRNSRKSFIEDDKTMATLRRASLISAATSAAQAANEANTIFQQDYQGAPLSDLEVERVEAEAVDTLGKLNAAVALSLNAHADSKNIDYDAAVNSMNTIKELLPELVKDAQAVSHTRGEAGREILAEVQSLIDAAHTVCTLTGSDDHQKMQEAAQSYADVSGRLVYIFGSANPRISADKENEMMDLAKDVGDMTTLLLMKANELTGLAQHEPASVEVDTAGVVCAERARSLLTTAQLTSPTIREPHCQSALNASAEGLASAAKLLALSYKPLVEGPSRRQMGEDLTAASMELARALDRLKNSYANLGPDEEEQISPAQAQKLKFIASYNVARGSLKNAEDLLDKPIQPTKLKDDQINDLQDSISKKLAQNNAAVASLLQAKSNAQDPDFDKAELAITTIAEVTPAVVNDIRSVLSTCEDDRARQAMSADVRAWCQGISDVCASAASDDAPKLDDAAKRFAKASKKLSFAFSPLARKAREQLMLELFNSAHKQALQMVEDTNKMADTMGGAGAGKLRDLGKDVQDSAMALQTTLMVTSPSLDSERCRSALLSSSAQLSTAASRLTIETEALQDDETGCRILNAKLTSQRANIAQHGDALQKALEAIKVTLEEATTVPEEVESPKQKVQRLKFVTSANAVREKAQEVEKLLEKPVKKVRFNAHEAEEMEQKRARGLAAVNAAVALLINAKNDRKNPNYGSAEQAMETVSELMPGIINDTKALSSLCEDEAVRGAMLRDIRDWCAAIQDVCARATQPDLMEFVESAQHFADTSGKLNFVFNPKEISPQEQQVLQLSESACDSARKMAEDAHKTSCALPPLQGGDLRVRASAVEDAAKALKTTAQLTAPCLSEPCSRATLISSSHHVNAAADDLIDTAHKNPDLRCKELATRLEEEKEVLEKALGRIEKTCNDEENVGEKKKAQRLKFIKGVSSVHEKLDAVADMLEQPASEIKLTDQQAKEIQDKLSRDIAQVNAAVASLIQANTDVQNPDYAMAEKSIETISQLMPSIIKDTKALSTTCKEEKARAATIDDARAWCRAIREVCDSGKHGDSEKLEAALGTVASASSKMRFIVSSRKNPMKESEVMQSANTAVALAKGMASEVDEVANKLKESVSPAMRSLSAQLHQAARELHTTAQLTSPTIHEQDSQTALISQAELVGKTAESLVKYATKYPHPGVKILGVQLQAENDKLLDALKDLKNVCASSKLSPATIKAQQQKLTTSASAAEHKAREAEKLLEKPVHGKLNDQETKDVQEKLSRAMAQVNAALAALVNAKSDSQPNYVVAEESLATISELMPEIIQDTKDLGTTCKEHAVRATMMADVHEWCRAIQAVCASAASDDNKELNESALKFAKASQKLRFIVTARKNPVKEQQIMQLSSSACDKARQMVDETKRVAENIKGDEKDMLLCHATSLSDAATALHTTAELTAPTIHEPHCQAALLSSADALSSSAQVLIRDTARAQHPDARRLSEEADRYRDMLDKALDGLRAAVKADDKRRPPPPPPVKRSSISQEARNSTSSPQQSPRVRVVSHSDTRRASQEWLRQMREDATRDIEANLPAGALTAHDVTELNKKAEEERLKKEAFDKSVDKATDDLNTAEVELDKLYSAKSVMPTLDVEQAEALQKQTENRLALAGIAAAKLVASSHPDVIDYATATQATDTLTELVPDLVKDAATLSYTRDERARRDLLDHIRALCEATKRLVGTARKDNMKVNEAAVEFGDKSASLLYHIASDADPAQEKQVIDRARAIGDLSSSLATRVADVSKAAGGDTLHALCDAGRETADAARSLVYTAKLVAPWIHHQQCQNSLITASHELSSKLKHFSNSWKPLSNDPQHAKAVSDMTTQANELEKLLESFRRDLAAGKLVKRRKVKKVIIEDTPLRQLAAQIMELAQMRAECGNTADDKKRAFSEYASSLRGAIHSLDRAAARVQQHPHDLNKYQDLEGAVQNLQISLLQSRPTVGDQQQNNVVDLTDFVKNASKEAENLLTTTTKLHSKKDKNELESIKSDCHQINVSAFRILNPADRAEGDETSLDGILEVDQFGQDCENFVQKIKTTIGNLIEKEPKDILETNSLALVESCGYLRFATKSAIATAQSASLDETLEDLNDFEKRVEKMLVPLDGSKPGEKHQSSASASLCTARARLIGEACALTRGGESRLPPALASYVTELRTHTDLHDSAQRDRAKGHISKVIQLLKEMVATTGARVATWQPMACVQLATTTEQLIQELENPPLTDSTDGDTAQVKILDDAHINRLLMPADVKIDAEPKRIEEKLQQTASKLVMLSDTLLSSTLKPESLKRTAPAAIDAALQLAAAAKSLPAKNLSQAKRTEEASQEMCWATYNLLKTAEQLTREPSRRESRSRLQTASRTLYDAINKLARSACNDKLSSECGTLTRALQAALHPPAPRAPPAFQQCMELLQPQSDVIQQLNSDEPMSREDFSKSLNHVTTAVCNTAEYAEQCAYLITLSESNKELAVEGLVDVPRLQRLTCSIQDSCSLVTSSNQLESIKEEEKEIIKANQELQQAVKEACAKTKDATAKRELTECAFKLDHAAKMFSSAVNDTNPSMDKISSCTLSLVDSASALNTALDQASLLPTLDHVSEHIKAMHTDITTHSKKLINKTQALINEVKNADDDEDPMTWVTYNTQRKSVIEAFDALVRSLRQNGERVGLLEVAKEVEEEPDVQKKSFIQIQEETARKWLQRKPSNDQVRQDGEQAATAIIDVAHEMAQDMKGNEKDEMLNLLNESRELVASCSKKYDSGKASVLMDRLREMRRAVERGAVTSVVEDLLHVDEPLADLDIMLDAERDEAKRKFLLEKKIAELMSQLGRTSRTARLIARTGTADKLLDKSREQTELLAPLLVKAAQERVSRPDDAAVVENYRVMLAQYTAALTNVRELCDRSVDPLDFVQTAGETMARMREESSHNNDPQTCAYTSKAITRLANRVIVVSMSSTVARSDPELRAALSEAQQKLAAAEPAPGTRESKLPDWKDTTDVMLRTTGEVESALGGENIFKKLPEPDQPIYNAALSLHSAVSGWSARDNDIVAVAKRMAVLMARLSEQMNTARRKESVTRKPWIDEPAQEVVDKDAEERKRELIATSKKIVTESREVAALAKKLAHECGDVRIKTNLLQVCERIPTISGQLKMLTTVKGSTLGYQGGEEDREAMNMLVTNAQNLMSSVQEVVKAAASASVKIASQRGLKWVRKNY